MNLIFIVMDRSVRLVTYDFEKALRYAVQFETSLITYALDESFQQGICVENVSGVLSDIYFSNISDLNELICEFEDNNSETNLFNIIPNAKKIIENVRNELIEKEKHIEEHHKKMQEEREYKIYLKVKERLGL